MGNYLCTTPNPSITIIIHSRDFEEEVCNPKNGVIHIEHPPTPSDIEMPIHDDDDFLRVRQV